MHRRIPPLRYVLAAFCIVSLTLVSGLIHGRLTHRWSPPPKLPQAAEELTKIPEELGPWRVREEAFLPDGTIQMLKCAGYINRTYRKQQTGERVAATLLLGSPGRIWPHSPAGCYPADRYTPLGPPRRFSIASTEGQSDAFWLAVLDVHAMSGTHLHVVYGWSDGGAWMAPDSPRQAFGGSDFLYKLQVAAFSPASDEGSLNPICTQFLETFLPAVRQHLLQADSVWSRPAPFLTASSHCTYSADWRLAPAMTRWGFPCGTWRTSCWRPTSTECAPFASCLPWWKTSHGSICHSFTSFVTAAPPAATGLRWTDRTTG